MHRNLCLCLFVLVFVSVAYAQSCWSPGIEKKKMCCNYKYYSCCTKHTGTLWWRKCVRWENRCGGCDVYAPKVCCTQNVWVAECMSWRGGSESTCRSSWAVSRAEADESTDGRPASSGMRPP